MRLVSQNCLIVACVSPLLGKSALLQRAIAAQIKAQLSVPWLPPSCRLPIHRKTQVPQHAYILKSRAKAYMQTSRNFLQATQLTDKCVSLSFQSSGPCHSFHALPLSLPYSVKVSSRKQPKGMLTFTYSTQPFMFGVIRFMIYLGIGLVATCPWSVIIPLRNLTKQIPLLWFIQLILVCLCFFMNFLRGARILEELFAACDRPAFPACLSASVPPGEPHLWT